MSYKIRLEQKKSLLAPEELLSRTEFLMFWVQDRWKRIALGGALLASLGLVWGGLVWFQGQRDDQAKLLEYEASKILSQSVAEGEAAGQDRKESYEEASLVYGEILEKYSSSSAAPFAQYQLGNIYFELEQYDRAIEAYGEFIERYPGHDILLPMVYQRLGYARLRQGDRQAALDTFEQLIQRSEAWNRDQAYFEAGRLYEEQGVRDSAIDRYEGLIKDFPGSPWSSEAQLRLKILGVFDEVPAGQAVPEGTGAESTVPAKEKSAETESGG